MEIYRGYKIDEDNTGFAPVNMQFHFYFDDGEIISGYGSSVKDCKNQIDELCKENQ